MIRLALDTMGGDFGPAETIEGALISLERGDVEPEGLLLVGAEQAVRDELERRGKDPADFNIVDAPDLLEGNETPVEAMRRKPGNSVAVGTKLVKDKQAGAFISSGNTGLVVATATLGLPRLEGIRRPGIAATIQGAGGPFTVIDVGANPQPKAQHLLHYALMGSAYMHDTFGVERPRVGLMNIGSEEKKGSPLVLEARELLKNAQNHFSFHGNVEGVDVFSGVCDVIVSDGFTGNVLLKVSEGVADYMIRTMGRVMGEENVPKEMRDKVLARVMRDVDYTEYGGALLLGVEGIVTICHGRSKGPAIANALRFASRAVGAEVNEHIVAAARDASATT